MQKTASSDAWAQLLLAEAQTRLQVARAGGVVAPVDDHPVWRPLHADGGNPVVRMGRLVRQLQEAMSNARGI
jgi:hypothetical protein